MNKLEKYLKNRSISQRGFAKKTGTTPNNLNLLLKGKSTPGLKLAYHIELQTDGVVKMEDWLSEEEKKPLVESFEE